MNFELEHRAGRFDHPVEGGPHPTKHRVANPFLHILYRPTGISFEPLAVEVLRDDPKLDNQVAGEVLRFDFSTLLAPEAEERGFVLPHNDPGVRTADERPAVTLQFPLDFRSHDFTCLPKCILLAWAKPEWNV